MSLQKKDLLYILDAKIQKQRLKDMIVAANKRNIPTANKLCSEVTYIVTEFTDYDAVLRKLGLTDEAGLQGAEVVSTRWFADCMRAGRVVPVEAHHRVQRVMPHCPQEDRKSETQEMPEFSCQRATPLQHHNEKYVRALEVLEKYADLREGEQDYSRALAFRRAACVLKSLPGSLTTMRQLRNIPYIGDHSKRVIQAILEEGECDEVENILRDPWFHHMKLFTGVFGIGPSTAKQLIARGWTTIEEVQEGYKSGDWRVQWGLAFYEDLSTPVLRAEADYIQNLVERHLKSLLPGAIVCVTGGFRRGKPSGHDVDILITHPQEDRTNGALPRLLHSLEATDTVACGRLERSTYSDDVLSKNTKLSTRGQLDHFEKWIGMLKVPKKVRDNKRNICDTLNGAENASDSSKTSGNEVDRKSNVHNEMIYSRNGASIASEHSASHVDVVNEDTSDKETGNKDPSVDDSFDMSQLKASHTKGDKQDSGEGTPQELASQNRDWLARRVDLIISPYSQYYYALVGWTGSKQFNRDARLYAERKLNMKLTSHGLYDHGSGRSISASSEKEVFDNLKLPYFDPADRNC